MVVKFFIPSLQLFSFNLAMTYGCQIFFGSVPFVFMVAVSLMDAVFLWTILYEFFKGKVHEDDSRHI